MKEQDVLEQLEIGYRMPKPQTCPKPVFVQCIRKCWNEDPDQRPTFGSICTFLSEYFNPDDYCGYDTYMYTTHKQ